MPDIEHRRELLAARVLIAISLVALVGMIPFVMIAERSGLGAQHGEYIVATFAPGFLVSGWWLVRRRPRLAVGWALLVGGASVAVAAAGSAYAVAALDRGWAGVAWGLWLFSWMWQPHMTLMNVATLMLPNGVVSGRAQRRLIWLSLWLLGLSMLLAFVQPGAIITTPDHLDGAIPNVNNPIGIDFLEPVTDVLLVPILMISLSMVMVSTAWTAVRWRRTRDRERRIFRWMTLVQLLGIGVPVIVLSVPAVAGTLAVLQTLVAQAVILWAILQWRAYAVDVAIRRSVVAIALLLGGLGVYAAVVVAVSVGLGQRGAVASTIGAAVAIFTFGPLSGVIRRGVNRLIYGRRDDPYAVVSELGRTLEVVASPAEGLDAVVGALTDELRLPFASIRATDGTALASRGELALDDSPTEIELRHLGAPVGALVLGHRRGSTAMTAADLALLSELARQIGATVAAYQLLDGLRSAQQHLVRTREDERRRLQRDLHDGLGPQLTAVTMKLDAARNHLASGGTERAGDLVVGARTDIQQSLNDVRRLVYSLGDPTLTSLGLKAAITDQVDQLTRNSGIEMSVDISAPSMPAATEEAVLRVVVEAVTNVVRHADARHCSVVVECCGERLIGSVVDDGIGLADGAPTGVGTRSMSDRVGALGGTLRIMRVEPRGSAVEFDLPLAGQ